MSEFESPEAFEEGFSKLVLRSYLFAKEVSGQKASLFYALADHYGKIVKTANTSFARFTTGDDTVFLENAERVSINGFFDFSKFIVTIPPGDTLDLTLSTDAIPEEWL